MPVSTYHASVPVFARGLAVLKTLLDRAEAHARDNGTAASALLAARLAPDMLPLSRQIQIAADTAKFAASRLTGGAAPSFADDETTFEQLRERCAKTIDYLHTVEAASFEGAETRQVTFGGPNNWVLPGDRYLLQFALPNFFFHVTTAYDIMRNAGVPVGKRDFLGPFDTNDT